MDDETLEDASLFQGFGKGWRPVLGALEMLPSMPTDVLESVSELDGIIAQRMGGMRSLHWRPLMVSALEAIKIEQAGLFVVVLSGEENVAARVAKWISAQSYPAFHIAPFNVPNATDPATFSLEQLRAHCETVLDNNSDRLSPTRLQVARTGLATPMERESVQLELRALGHNVLTPNHMSLSRAKRTMRPGERFAAHSEAEYVDAILESIRPIDALRNRIGERNLHAMAPIRPGLIVTEPALYRHVYRNKLTTRDEGAAVVGKIMRLFQKQSVFLAEADVELVKLLHESELARFVMSIRQEELLIHTMGVGLLAAQTTSAVLRLSPGVNHVFAELSNYARHIRADKPEARMKARRLFEGIQHKLAKVIGDERLAHIAAQEHGVRIVADAPIEWLPIGNLPLSLRFNCSRINATPGNLMMGTLIAPEPVTVSPNELQKVLIVSSFSDTDPLRGLLERAVNAVRGWQGRIEVIFKTAQTTAAFVEAVNQFDGMIMIFDGHGVPNDKDSIGALRIGDENVDVWSLRGTIRVPPIVLLSACDTHGIDSSTHATVGNGFLALGARTVLATLLPVDGLASASFIARLVYRLADFLPAALKTHHEVLTWTEVIAGMLRMLLTSEVLDRLVGPPAGVDTPRGRIQAMVNAHINSYDPGWFEKLIDHVAEYRKEDRRSVEDRIAGVLSRSEAIRYVQLGNPETILIDDGSIRARFVTPELQKQIDEVPTGTLADSPIDGT